MRCRRYLYPFVSGFEAFFGAIHLPVLLALQEGSETPLSSRDALFYAIVGSLEEKIMEPSFRDGVTIFCRKHCREYWFSTGTVAVCCHHHFGNYKMQGVTFRLSEPCMCR